MPPIPINVDKETLATTSIITAAIFYFFLTVVFELKPSIALAIATVIGFILYSTGIIPIGLLAVVGIAMIGAIIKRGSTGRNASGASNADKERHKLGYAGASEDHNSKQVLNNFQFRHFRIDGGDPLDPRTYGLISAGKAFEFSHDAVLDMIGAGETIAQKQISSNAGTVQLHVLALITAAFYVCGAEQKGVDKDVESEIAAGIIDGFTAIIGGEEPNAAVTKNVKSVYELFGDYVSSLYRDLRGNEAEVKTTDSFTVGRTSRLVASNIAGQCGILKLLAENDIERNTLEKIVARVGYAQLLRMLIGKNITFAN